MKRIYLAGPYNADNICSCLDHMRQGIDCATWLVVDGYAVFCPWLDFMYRLLNPGVTREMYQAQSMAWLEASDAVLVLPYSEWQKSKGTMTEISRAIELGIPVYYNLEELKKEVSVS